jgi:type II secretory pathway predicted ATPase ExeA
MANEVDNLILEHLRALRGDNAEVKRRLGNLEIEVARLGKLVAVVIDGQQHILARMAEFEARFERIERRLELRAEPSVP